MESNTKAAYSANQQKFIRAAKRAGFEIDYTYSGRFMYGQRCPAVRLDYKGEFVTRAKVEYDSMGLGVVVYARF